MTFEIIANASKHPKAMTTEEISIADNAKKNLETVLEGLKMAHSLSGRVSIVWSSF